MYFSSSINKNEFLHISSNTHLMSRIGTLKEMNLEYVMVDESIFTTSNGNALEVLFGENAYGILNSIKFALKLLRLVFSLCSHP